MTVKRETEALIKAEKSTAAAEKTGSTLEKFHTDPKCPQLVALTKMPAVPMIFPYSSRSQGRTLVLRNDSDLVFIIKFIPSNSKLLKAEKTMLFCDAHSTEHVKIELDSEQLANPKATELNEFLYVFCIVSQNRGVNEARTWLKNDACSPSYLAYKFSIIRSKEFAALETVADLPGHARPLKSISKPSYKVDDSDCLTAHNIDSDTETMMPLSDDELLAALPPDSMITTANDGTRCFLSRMLGHIFPISGRDEDASAPCGGSA